jgi:cytoskeletal protein CcmA (bactofilin family)
MMSLDNANSNQTASQGQTLPVSTHSSDQVQLVAVRSSIGKGVFIKGDILSGGDMLISGRVEGTVALKNNKLEIGAHGYIVANIFAEEVIVSGQLEGDIYASKSVRVTNSGRVNGDIYSADVSIEDGAHISGEIDMQGQDIFKQHAVPGVQDEGQGKASLGFLFKKHKESQRTEDHPIAQDYLSINVSEELMRLAGDDKKVPAEISFIQDSVMIKGQLIAEEDVVMNGQIEGVVYLKNNQLGLGPCSYVKGSLFVKSLVAHGKIEGDVYANELVMIKKPAQIYGTISSPRFSSDPGVTMKGKVKVEAQEQDVEEIFTDLVESVNGVEGEVAGHAQSTQLMQDENAEVATNTSKDQTKDSSWPIFYPRS